MNNIIRKIQYFIMPRTAFHYAIERISEELKEKVMQK